MRFWMTIGVLAAAFSGAMTPGVMTLAAAQDYPREIQVRFETAREECKDAGGHGPDSKGVVVKPEAIRKLGLNGDRRDDYIVDYTHVSCDDNRSYFCGSGGCYLAILIGKPDGSFATVYDDQVLGYELSKKRGPRIVTLALHHNDCHDGREFCVKRGRITAKPLVLKAFPR